MNSRTLPIAAFANSIILGMIMGVAFDWSFGIPVITTGLGYLAREFTPPARRETPETQEERQARFRLYTSAVITFGVVIVALAIGTATVVKISFDSGQLSTIVTAVTAILTFGR